MLARSSRLQSVVVGKASQQKLEAALTLYPFREGEGTERERERTNQ